MARPSASIVVPIPPLAALQFEIGSLLNDQNVFGAQPSLRLATREKRSAVECLTAAIYYEGRSEPAAGQRAVAQVVLNRRRHPAFPDTVCGVVYQGAGRRSGCQFSFTCDGSMKARRDAVAWERARTFAVEALAGGTYQPIGLATHYHRIDIQPYWAARLRNVTAVGLHRFYALTGKAGDSAAFTRPNLI